MTDAWPVLSCIPLQPDSDCPGNKKKRQHILGTCSTNYADSVHILGTCSTNYADSLSLAETFGNYDKCSKNFNTNVSYEAVIVCAASCLCEAFD